MKKICINLTMFSEKISGTGNFIKRIIIVLQQLDNENSYILLINSKIPEPEILFSITSKNFKIKKIRFIKNKINRIFYEQVVFPLQCKNYFDIFFSPVPSVPIYFSLGKTKIISTIHDLIPFKVQGKYKKVQQGYVKFITRKASSVCDDIITVSKNSKLDVCENFQINPNKIHIVYNFVEKKSYEDVKRNNIFFFVGNIQPGKNIRRLLEAFNLFSLETKGYELHLLGRIDWENKDLKKLIKIQQTSNQIHFKGYVDNDTLDEYYRNSAALIYPSLYEGFGIPPLEAISYGCPIVISNISSLPEVGGKAAIYVDPYSVDSIKNGMIRAIDSHLIKEKRKYYDEQLKKFDGLVQTTVLLDLFKRI